MSTLTQTVAGWLLTYAIHSTILLGVAWLVLRLRRVNAATTEVLWKIAVIGGIATASLQTAFDFRPVGTFNLAAAATPVPVSTFEGPTTPSTPVSPIPVQSANESNLEAEYGQQGVSSGQASSTKVAQSSLPLGSMVLWSWLVLAVGMILWYTGRRLILIGRLGDRQVLVDGEAVELLQQLKMNAGITRRIQLTASRTISSPVALGQDEICLPGAALVELDLVHQRAMLAHELAHLVRRDPHWLMLTCLLERIFFFQPLNRIARRGVQESAEYMADDWAARHSGGVPLARCLVKVAEWMQASPLGVPVAGFAEERSQLSTRVTRLLDGGASIPRSSGRSAVFVSVVGLVLVVFLAPGVSGRVHPTGPLDSIFPDLSSAPNIRLNDSGPDSRSESTAKSEVETSSRTDHNTSSKTNTVDGTDLPVNGISSGFDIAILSQLNLSLTGGKMSQTDTAIVRALMVRLAQDSDAEVRAAAANALGRIENPMAIPVLVTALADENDEVRHAAIDALFSFDEGVPAAPIRKLLASDDSDVRGHAIEMLGEMRDVASGSAISAMLDDPDKDIRYRAIQALGEIGDRAAIDAIRKALDDNDANMRIMAMNVLDDFDVKIDPAVIRRALHDANSDLRQMGLRFAGNRRMADLKDDVASLLDDLSSDIRERALDALAEMGADVPASAIASGLSDSSEDVRQTAAHIAGDRRVVGVVPRLIELLNDPSGDVRESAAEALTEIRNDAARNALRGAMNHSDRNVRRIAVEFFGEEADS